MRWTIAYPAASALIVLAIVTRIASESDYNVVNDDGSFKFGLSTNDLGGHYHSATGTRDQVVSGRYGSRSPATGQLEQVTYTAGPRGFRARGANIHRNQDLSQVPRGRSAGSPDDPLADPFDDPSYAFRFRTSEYQRREDADRLGRVNGLYSYLDDVGDRHSVRYAAGAGTGYQVSNAVPDAPNLVKYSAPLYKTSRNARGKVSYERGPGGQYKFIASAPDQRRSESTGADGITRGSYSYLDDKGVQRTVEYIAGAGIGYKIVQSSTGPGSHLNPRPAIPQFGPSPSNDITDAEGSGFKKSDGGSYGPRMNPSSSGGGSGANRYGGSGGSRPSGGGSGGFGGGSGSFAGGSGGFGGGDDSSEFGRGSSTSGANRGDWNEGNGRGSSDSSAESNNSNRFGGGGGSNRFGGGGGSSESNRGFGSSAGSSESSRGYGSANRFGSSSNRGSGASESSGGSAAGTSQVGGSGEYASGSAGSIDGSSSHSGSSVRGGSLGGGSSHSGGASAHGGRRPGASSSGASVTGNVASLAIDRHRDWAQGGRDSTIVKNVGNWYVGLPPGSAVRAHVQNIDLLPLGSRTGSPSEALRKDVQRARNFDDYYD